MRGGGGRRRPRRTPAPSRRRAGRRSPVPPPRRSGRRRRNPAGQERPAPDDGRARDEAQDVGAGEVVVAAPRRRGHVPAHRVEFLGPPRPDTDHRPRGQHRQAGVRREEFRRPPQGAGFPPRVVVGERDDVVPGGADAEVPGGGAEVPSRPQRPQAGQPAPRRRAASAARTATVSSVEPLSTTTTSVSWRGSVVRRSSARSRVATTTVTGTGSMTATVPFPRNPRRAADHGWWLHRHRAPQLLPSRRRDRWCGFPRFPPVRGAAAGRRRGRVPRQLPHRRARERRPPHAGPAVPPAAVRHHRVRPRPRTRGPRAALRLPGLARRLPQTAARDAEGRSHGHVARARPGQGEGGAVPAGLDVGDVRGPAGAPPARELLGAREPRRAARGVRRVQAVRGGPHDGLPDDARRGHRDRPHLQHLRSADAGRRRSRDPHVHPAGPGGRTRHRRRGRRADAVHLLRRRPRHGDPRPGGERTHRSGEHRQPHRTQRPADRRGRGGGRGVRGAAGVRGASRRRPAGAPAGHVAGPHLLDWEPRVDWADGLARTVAWFREQEAVARREPPVPRPAEPVVRG